MLITDTNAPREREGGLSDLPDPQSLSGLLANGHQPNEDRELQFSLETPLGSLVPDNTQSKKAITVGPISPPIPSKLAEKIWRGEFIDLDELLPARLGAPGPTVLDALFQGEKAKPKKNISTIEEWVLSFNTLISVVAMRNQEQVRDLLAYSSTIVKASQDFQGSPWKEYDTHFRKQIATQSSPQWATIDVVLWAIYFARATPKSTSASTSGTGSAEPDDHKIPQQKRQQNLPRSRYNPYGPTRVCFRWNSRNGCQLIDCKFRHCCVRCCDPAHTSLDCPQQRPLPPPPRPQEQFSQETNFRPPSGRR